MSNEKRTSGLAVPPFLLTYTQQLSLERISVRDECLG